MSPGGDLFALSGGVATEPSFEIAIRGYDRKQVNQYVTNVEAEVAALAAEREQAYAQIQALAAQVEQLELELNDLRHRVASTGPTSFRHLGPRVEQILALAEDQAEAIKANAIQEIADQRGEADRILESARMQAAEALRDFELALAARRAEEHRIDAELVRLSST